MTLKCRYIQASFPKTIVSIQHFLIEKHQKDYVFSKLAINRRHNFGAINSTIFVFIFCSSLFFGRFCLLIFPVGAPIGHSVLVSVFVFFITLSLPMGNRIQKLSFSFGRPTHTHLIVVVIEY